jgi:hypothetical protein
VNKGNTIATIIAQHLNKIVFRSITISIVI